MTVAGLPKVYVTSYDIHRDHERTPEPFRRTYNQTKVHALDPTMPKLTIHFFFWIFFLLNVD